MRITILILIIGALVYLGWEKPLRERTPWRTPPPVAKAPPTPSGGWMWDKGRKTSLDRPAYNQHHGVTGPTSYIHNEDPLITSPRSTPSGASILDPSHHFTLEPPKKSPTPH